MTRLISFDIAKAICIMLVVIGHYVPAYSPEWYMRVHDVIYTFHMPLLFMFASGFIYMATKKNVPYKDFLWKKVKRLMVPYLSVSVIVITIKMLTKGHAYVENPVTVMSYVKMFYLPEAGYFLWFIWALWWMFVIVPLFKTKQLRLGLFALAIVLHYVPGFLPEVFCLKQFQAMLAFFMLGVLCCDWKAELSFVKKVPVWSVLGVFCIAESMMLMDIRGGANRVCLALPRNSSSNGSFFMDGEMESKGEWLVDGGIGFKLYHLSFPYYFRGLCQGSSS